VPFTDSFISAGDDSMVKIWNKNSLEAVASFRAKSPLTYIDHHRSKKLFATSSAVIDLWDHERYINFNKRSEPIHSMSWGAETITSVKFNQTETSVLASCGTGIIIC
jgi:WD repeat and SOF domain-containing protein 1